MLLADVVMYAAIISSMEQYYKSQAVQLKYSSSDTYKTKTGVSDYLVKLLINRILEKHLVPITAWPVEEFNMDKSNEAKQTASRTIFMLLTDDTVMQGVINKYIELRGGKSAAKWLLFLQHPKTITTFFKDIVIPFDREFLVIEIPPDHTPDSELIIKEIFHITTKLPLQVRTFGKWSEATGFKPVGGNIGMYNRRHDLQGITLNITTIENYPITLLDNPILPTKLIGGYFGDVWSALEQRMNFTSKIRVALDNVSGSKDANGKWSGMIGQVVREEVEVALSDFTMTGARVPYVEFVVPAIIDSYYIYVRRPDNRDVHWSGFLAPFSTWVWWSLAASVIIFPVAISLIEAIERKFNKSLNDMMEQKFHVNFLNVFRTFCSQGPEETPAYVPTRIIYVMLYVTAVVILAAYSAALISFLTVQTFTLPFDSFESLLKIGNYKFGVIVKSAESDMFSKGLSKLFIEINRTIMDQNFPITYKEGLLRVCNEPAYSFLLLKVLATAIIPLLQPCKFEPIQSNVRASVGFIMAKDHPFVGLFNYNIQLLRDRGILKRLQLKAWPTKVTELNASWDSLEITGIVPILALLAVAAAASLVLLLLECKICTAYPRLHHEDGKFEQNKT